MTDLEERGSFSLSSPAGIDWLSVTESEHIEFEPKWQVQGFSLVLQF